MVEVCGKPIIGHQVDSLLESGLTDITVVVGYKSEMVSAYLGSKCKYLVNEEFESTGSLHTMMIAREEYEGQSFLLLNADVVFDNECVSQIINSSYETAALVDPEQDLKDGEMNVIVGNDKRITAFSKLVPAKEATALSLQIVKFSGKDSKLLFNRASILMQERITQLFPAKAYDSIIDHSSLYAIIHKKGFWAEIDTLDDYKNCELSLSEYLKDNLIENSPEYNK